VTSSPNGGKWTLSSRGERVRPTPGKVAVLIGLFVLALVVAKSCQQSQIRIDQQEAIALAKQQVAFEPKETQVRLVRQGLNRKPFWFVSLSDPIGSPISPEGFTRLVLVKIDANKGTVEEVSRQGEDTGAPQEPADTKSKAAP
jgi:hypothetical protein